MVGGAGGGGEAVVGEEGGVGAGDAGGGKGVGLMPDLAGEEPAGASGAAEEEVALGEEVVEGTGGGGCGRGGAGVGEMVERGVGEGCFSARFKISWRNKMRRFVTY